MHSDLIAKLEALDGPDREVDLELTTKFFGGREADLHRAYGLHCYDFTSSLDAAIALVERVLGEDIALELLADVAESAKTDTINGTLKDIPIALLIAALRAMEALDG